jgi:hypothetical protein
MSAILLAACGGDSEPSDFDPAGLETDLNRLERLDTPVLSQIFDGVDDVLGASAMGAAAGRPYRTLAVRPMVASLLSGRAGASVAAIPSEIAGKTYAYDVESGSYVASDRTGAPDDGVRILLYAQDIEGNIVEPLQETGHVDITDLSNGATRSARLVAVEDGDTQADFTTTATGDGDNGTVGLKGYVVSSSGRFDMDFTLQSTSSGGSTHVGLSSTLGFPEHDATFDFDVASNFTDEGSDEAGSLTIDIRTPSGHVEIAGDTDGEDDLAGTITVNGDAWATFADGTVTGSDGHTLTSDEQSVLEHALNVSVESVLLPATLVVLLAALLGALPGVLG